MHGIIWQPEYIKENINKEIKEIWRYGYIWAGYEINGKTENYVNEKTVNYCIKYMMKQDIKNQYYTPKILTSKGIGAEYTKKQKGDWQKKTYNELTTDETYNLRNGQKINTPTYWRNKIYTEEEREKLWIEKLNKQERYILGQKIDISRGEELYYKMLKEAQEKNKRLGYGSDQKNWDREEYERERRIIMQKKRIEAKK